MRSRSVQVAALPKCRVYHLVHKQTSANPLFGVYSAVKKKEDGVTNSVFFCFAPCVPFCRVVYSVDAQQIFIAHTTDTVSRSPCGCLSLSSPFQARACHGKPIWGSSPRSSTVFLIHEHPSTHCPIYMLQPVMHDADFAFSLGVS